MTRFGIGSDDGVAFGHGSDADALNHDTMARARAHTISPNSVNCTAPYAQWTDAVGSAINLHQFIMNVRGSRTHGEGFEN